MDQPPTPATPRGATMHTPHEELPSVEEAIREISLAKHRAIMRILAHRAREVQEIQEAQEAQERAERERTAGSDTDSRTGEVLS